MPTITIKTETHEALKKAAADRGTGVGALAEALLLGGIAKREADRVRRTAKPSTSVMKTEEF